MSRERPQYPSRRLQEGIFRSHAKPDQRHSNSIHELNSDETSDRPGDAELQPVSHADLDAFACRGALRLDSHHEPTQQR